ncbi:MAG TPA: hypothetical protein VI248_09730 [Kineosporiaceae bacterium]
MRDLAEGLQLLLRGGDLEEAERTALLEVAELARIALDQDLVMVVAPD